MNKSSHDLWSANLRKLPDLSIDPELCFSLVSNFRESFEARLVNEIADVLRNLRMENVANYGLHSQVSSNDFREGY